MGSVSRSRKLAVVSGGVNGQCAREHLLQEVADGLSEELVFAAWKVVVERRRGDTKRLGEVLH